MNKITNSIEPQAAGIICLLILALGPSAHGQTNQGSALSFDGVNDVVQIGGPTISPPWTAEFWVNRQDADNTSALLLYGTSTALKLEQFNNNRKVGFTQYGVNDYAFNYVAPVSTWVHLAFVANTDTRLYVNGILQGTIATNISLTLGQLGGDTSLSHGANFSKGVLDEIRIWSVARSQAEIQANLTRSLVLPQANLVAYWRLDEATGTSASDSSGQGHTGTLVDGPAWVQSTFPYVAAVATQPASAITTNSATINGTVNPNSSFAFGWFQWGQTTNYENTTSLISLGSGTNTVLVQNALSGLANNTTYHYRVIGTNAGLGANGSDLTFTTGQHVLNSWVNPLSGKWENAQFWSAGAPALDQAALLITNAESKTVTIDGITVLAPSAMTVSNLTVGGTGGTNTLQLTNSGTNGSLHIVDNLTIFPGGSLKIVNSALTVDNGTIPITSPNGSEVELDGLVTVTNGVLNTSNAMYTTIGGGIFGGGGTGNVTMNNSIFTPHNLLVGYLFNGAANFLNCSLQCGYGLTMGGGGGVTGNLSIMGGSFIATNGYFGPDSILVGLGVNGTGNLVVSNANVQLGATAIANYAAGTLTVESGSVMSLGKTYLGYLSPNSSGLLSLLGGQITVPELHIGVQGTGVVNVAADTLTATTITVGETNTASGSLNVSGGTTLVSSSLHVGSSGSRAQLQVAGGLLAVTNSAQNSLLDIAGGSVSLLGGTIIMDALLLTNENGRFNLLGGITTVKSSSRVANSRPFIVGDPIGLNGPSTLNLPSGTHSFSNGLITVGGSTLAVGCARIDGPILNNGTMFANCSNGLASVTGSFTNNGVLIATNDCLIAFYGAVVNNGVILSAGGDFRFLGSLVNNGAITYAAETNYALSGLASQSSTAYNGAASQAIDGNTDGNFADGSVAQTAGNENPAWWQVNLGAMKSIGRINVWFRTDGSPDQADNFKLIVKDGASNVVWQQQYSGQPPASVTFNFVPPILGQIVRVESSGNPGGLLSLAEVQVFAPAQNESINLIQDLPANVTAEVNHSALLGPISALVGEAFKDQLTYQWQLNGADIPGATGPGYTTPILGFADTGKQYRSKVSLPGLSVISRTAMLSVVPDTTMPQLVSVTFTNVASSDLSGTPWLTMILTFNERMDPASLSVLSNYSFSAGTIQNAFVPDGQSVGFLISGIAPPNTPYSLSVQNIRDFSGNVLQSLTNEEVIPFYTINHALSGTASQSSTAPGRDAGLAIDGNTNGNFDDGSVTLNAYPEAPGWWEVDLGAAKQMGQVHLWFRTDCCNGLPGVAGPARDDNFTLKVLDASRLVIWTNRYTGTPPSDIFFNFAPLISGRYVRFESELPLANSDGLFSLAEVQILAPFTNAELYAEIARSGVSPTNHLVRSVENHAATIGPVDGFLANAPTDQLQFQWQRNGAAIAGATRDSYEIPSATLNESGDRYQCQLTLPGLHVMSASFTLEVIADSSPPGAFSLLFGEQGTGALLKATLQFDEPINGVSLTNLANFQFTGGNIVSNLTAGPGSTSVSFLFQPTVGSNGHFSLALGGLFDQSGNALGVFPVVSGLIPFSLTNLALSGQASQSSIGLGAGPHLAIDGNTDGNFAHNSVTLNAAPEQAGWWEIDLGAEKYVGRVHFYFRTDCCLNRQDNFIAKILDGRRNVVWEKSYPGRPPSDAAFNISPPVSGRFVRFEPPLTQPDQGAFSLAEVQVFPPFATNIALQVAPKLYSSAQGTNVTLSWHGKSALQTAPSTLGPWTTITNAANPYTVPFCAACSHLFFRVISDGVASIFSDRSSISLDNFTPAEAWPDGDVTAQFSVYNGNFHSITGFVTGHVESLGDGASVLSTYWTDRQLEELSPGEQASGSLHIKSWNLLLLAPYVKSEGFFLPATVFNDPSLDNDPNLRVNPFQRPAGQYALVVEYWEQDPKGSVVLDGTRYRLASADSVPIDIYPPAAASKFSDFARILKFESVGALTLTSDGQRTAGYDQVIHFPSTILAGGYPAYKTHPGTIMQLVLSNLFLDEPGHVSARYIGDAHRVEDPGGNWHFRPYENASSLTEYLILTGNCGPVTASASIQTIQPLPPKPNITFTITPSDGGAPDGYINAGDSAVLHWSVANCQSCVVGLRGQDVSTGKIVLNQPSGLASSGTLTVKPPYWTWYTISATSSANNQSAEASIKRSCGVYNSPAEPPKVFWFKMTNPDSFALPCFGTTIFANDASSAHQIAQSLYPGYTATEITESQFNSGNICP